jgi:hypothetical protein
MLENRVLVKDEISPLLDKYRAGIGIAENNSGNRDRIKEVLEHFNHHDEFYAEMGIRDGSITWAHGMNNWLRHPDPEINVSANDYLVQYVHPFIAGWYRYFLLAMTKIFTERATQYLTSRFCISVPVRDKEGHYYLVKHMGIVFGKDEKDQLASTINSYFICGAYHGEPLKVEIFESNEKTEDQASSRLLELVYPCMEINSPKLQTLTHVDFFFIDLILEVISNGETRTAKSVREAHDRKKKKAIGKEAIKKRLTRLKQRLQWLLCLDVLPQEYLSGRNKEFLPNYRNIFELVSFLEQSGIIAQLKNYFDKKRQGGKKKVAR